MDIGNRERKTWKILILAVSIALILICTVLFRESREELPKTIKRLFWSYKAWVDGDAMLGKQILLNILLFMPLGFSLAQFTPKNWLAVLEGLLLSITIEVVQLTFGLGLFEYDDMISNTLGTATGVIVQRVLKIQNSR